MTNFTILVYFDAVCAWCFVGQRALNQAIALCRRTYPGGKDDTFTFTYHPFYLRTNSPKKGTPLRVAMTAKNGEGKADRIFGRVALIGRGYGIVFNIDGKTGDTRLCHQISIGGDITSSQDLIVATEEVGLAAAKVELWVLDQEVASEVDKLAAKAREKGITSVPTFEINGVRAEGAEDVGGMFEALVEAKSRLMA